MRILVYFPELPVRIKGKQERNEQHAKRALETIQNFVKSFVKLIAWQYLNCVTI